MFVPEKSITDCDGEEKIKNGIHQPLIHFRWQMTLLPALVSPILKRDLVMRLVTPMTEINVFDILIIKRGYSWDAYSHYVTVNTTLLHRRLK